MKYFLLIFGILGSLSVDCQSVGDTIKVKVFDFDSTTRDTAVVFPSDTDIEFEKVLLKYTMRCPDGLVNDGSNTQGCGRWDFSCNTYLVDSAKIETVSNLTPDHFVTNFAGTVFPYVASPSYNYLRGIQTNVEIINTNNENSASIGVGTSSLDAVLKTENRAGKSQYLYTSDELTSAGFTAGNIDALSLEILNSGGEARFMKIKIKPTSKTQLDGLVDLDGFTEVYYKNTNFDTDGVKRFNFHTPFLWDGISNILVEFNFSNISNSTSFMTSIEGEATAEPMGLSAVNESEIMLTNETYLECNNYTGILGSQNRTVEAWVRTNDGSSAEIIAWGVLGAGRKWVLRFQNGMVRLENQNGGTVSTKTVDDGEWHHIACVLDGSTLADIRFYIDGELDVNSSQGTSAFNTSESPVRISRGLNNRYMDGVIDEVRIWNTNLSGATINEWKTLKLDSSHPNYDNLELYYPFGDAGDQIVDASGNGRDASIIGSKYEVSHLDGETLFKDFVLQNSRPNVTFHQGDYITQVETTTVDKPIVKESQHFVVSRSVDSADPTTAVHDIIVDADPVEYWSTEEIVYDEITGDIISETTLSADGEIVISDMEYFTRYPFYNELVSFVTPYGIGLDLGTEGKSWYIDMSDYVSILRGNKRLLMTLGGQLLEEYDMEFLFIVGTPPRDVLQYEQIWQGTNRIVSAQIAQILDDSKFAPTSLQLDNAGESFKLKSSISGHGVEGEFQQNGGVINHIVTVDQDEVFIWNIQQECSFNPIFPQGGTWIYDRQGWCPGERTFMNEQDLTPFVTAGGTLNIDYTTTQPNVPTGEYRYHVAHQLVTYGPANFQLDASIVDVIAPNNTAEYTRVGNICANPSVIIKNTGATPLTNLTINYWINESQSPQSYEWTGDLDFMEEAIVDIPSSAELWYDLLEDQNMFYVEISNPNQGQDEYSFNNKMSTSFDFPQVISSDFVTVEFRTNNFPIENSYQLMDSEGNVVGANNLPAANNTYSDDYELLGSCYKLIVQDSGGDGVQWWANPNQGTGAIRLLDENGSVLKTFEPDFGGGFEFSFSTEFPVSAEDLDFLTSFKIYPNPASAYCSVAADDLSNTSVYIMDALGQRVPTNILSRSTGSMSLDLEGLPQGIYFVVLIKGELVTTRKLIVE